MNRRGFLAALLSAPIAYAAVPKVLEALVPPAPIAPAGEWGASIVSEYASLNAELSAIVRKAFTARLVAQIYDTSPLMRQLLKKAREPSNITYQGVPIEWDTHIAEDEIYRE